MLSKCGKDYDIIFLDAQIILTRNHSMVGAHCRDLLCDDFGEFIDCKWSFDEVVRRSVTSFWYSIAKLLRAYSTKKLVFLWDKSPYHKARIIKEMYQQDTYKSDRVFDTSEISYCLFCARQAARQHIMDSAKLFGIRSIIHPGYEADDLAFISARLFPDQKIGLASHDSDWPYYLTPNSEVINTMKFNLIYYDKFKDETLLGMDPYEYVRYSSSFYGSHNNLLRTVSKKHYKREFEEVYADVIAGENLEEIFDDKSLFDAQLASWDIMNFPEIEDVKSEILNSVNEPIKFGTDQDWLNNWFNSSGIKVYMELKKNLS